MVEDPREGPKTLYNLNKCYKYYHFNAINTIITIPSFKHEFVFFFLITLGHRGRIIYSLLFHKVERFERDRL